MAAATWRVLGGLVAARSGDNPSAESDRLLQSLSVALHRENARAVLRRLPAEAAQPSPFAEPLHWHLPALPTVARPPLGSVKPLSFLLPLWASAWVSQAAVSSSLFGLRLGQSSRSSFLRAPWPLPLDISRFPSDSALYWKPRPEILSRNALAGRRRSVVQSCNRSVWFECMHGSNVERRCLQRDRSRIDSLLRRPQKYK